MNDPFNQLPVDPEWLRQVEEVAEHAAKELDSVVLLVAIQPRGKICVSVEGTTDNADLAELVKDPWRLLLTLAAVTHVHEHLPNAGEKH